MGLSDVEWTDVSDLLASLEKVTVRDRNIAKASKTEWSKAHESFVDQLPPGTCLTITQRFEWESSTVKIFNTGRFQLLKKLKIKNNVMYSVGLCHTGKDKPMWLCHDQTGCWKPNTPILLRDVEYIVITVDGSNTGNIMDLSLCRSLDPVLRTRLTIDAMKQEVSKGVWLFVPSRPLPYLA